MAAGYLLGVDVGTTRTAAATCRAGAHAADPEVVNLGDRSSAVPSVLYLGGTGVGDGGLVVGAAAERRAPGDPEHIAREFKRRVGDPTPLVVGGHPWAAEQLSALLVRWVVDRVAQREGGRAERIAVTHPASWGAPERDLFADALRGRDLQVAFLPEPQAAALHYAAAERVEPGSTIAVYDFGGGTFDAAVLRKEPRGFSPLGRPEGVQRLGGIDLDALLFEHVVRSLPTAFDGLDEDDPAVLSALAAVRRECTEAKEALSADTEVSIPVLTPAGRGSVRLRRGEFEAMIAPHLEETVAALRRAIESASVAAEELTAVLLVGGSSRIPLVAQMVSAAIGRPVAVDADPKEAIAKGAALSLTRAAATATGTQARQGRGRTGRHAAAVPETVALLGAGTGAGSRSGGGAAAPFGGATERINAPAQAGPPPRPAAGSEPGGYEPGGYEPGGYEPGGYDEPEFAYAAPPLRRRGPAWLVGAGAAGAAAAVLAAAFLVPRSPVSTVSGLDAPASAAATTTTAAPAPTPEPAPITTLAPVPVRLPERTTTHSAPPPPPVPTSTVAVPTTTPPPPTTTPTRAETTTPTPTPTSTKETSTTVTAGTSANGVAPDLADALP